ncbi:unnamed protein product [Vitrella brassicaformis CCMP3155]|uniref:Uncharacterized protein n=1 Tax=Vitrella brassicaformis (strain CCMP3155) TaxID=1169540 RepID=A0A0G4EMT9_VITBC|nr:unnamed protein product [Vitrella brassicaformis CCMP3155]|eukprot:CEL98486.1 unnamed protein product [Vitrella brassicaformis CCMP3155]
MKAAHRTSSYSYIGRKLGSFANRVVYAPTASADLERKKAEAEADVAWSPGQADKTNERFSPLRGGVASAVKNTLPQRSNTPVSSVSTSDGASVASDSASTGHIHVHQPDGKAIRLPQSAIIMERMWDATYLKTPVVGILDTIMQYSLLFVPRPDRWFRGTRCPFLAMWTSECTAPCVFRGPQTTGRWTTVMAMDECAERMARVRPPNPYDW